MHYIPERNEESSSDDDRPKLKLHGGRYIRKSSMPFVAQIDEKPKLQLRNFL